MAVRQTDAAYPELLAYVPCRLPVARRQPKFNLAQDIAADHFRRKRPANPY